MLDPDSADWVDSPDQDTDDDIRVEDGPLHPRKVATGSRATLDHVGYRGLFQVTDFYSRHITLSTDHWQF